MTEKKTDKKLNKAKSNRPKKDLRKLFALTKKRALTLWFICFILFILLLVIMLKNRTVVRYYNLGVDALKNYEYEEAEDKFSDALLFGPSRFRECRVRINYALSITSRITPNSVSYENLEESIESLLEARGILVENGCAHENDTNGHSRKSETLKAEIDDYIEWLRENNPPPEENESKKEKKEENNQENKDKNQEKGGDTQKEEENNKEENEENKKKEELRELIESAETIGQQERFIQQEWSENVYGFSSFSGKSW